MSARRRLLLETAFVSAVVGGGAAALVSWCGERDEAETHTSTTTTSGDGVSASASDAAMRAVEAEPAAPTARRVPPAAEPSTVEVPAEERVDVAPRIEGGDVDAGVAPAANVARRVEDAGVAVVAEEAVEAGAPTNVASEPTADAGVSVAALYDRLFRAPSFAAGAGRFALEPSPLAASAYTPPENAGAGSFTLTPAPWAASAYTPPENAGAGAFTTERSAVGGVVVGGFPFSPFLFPIAPPPEPVGSP